MTNEWHGKIAAGFVGVWFLFCLVGSALHLFVNDPSRPPIAVGIAVLTPILLFVIWFNASEGFQRFTLSLNPRTLTTVQSWRIAGFAFLVLYAYHLLPGLFALPAGWGDVFIGATAIFVSMRLASPEHRLGFILWQALGISDLVIALTTGTPAGLIDPHGISTRPMSELPLSLIPTFAVPLLMILHFICIAQARRWPVIQRVHLREQLSSSTS
jgi:hypothetical protein